MGFCPSGLPELYICIGTSGMFHAIRTKVQKQMIEHPTFRVVICVSWFRWSRKTHPCIHGRLLVQFSWFSNSTHIEIQFCKFVSCSFHNAQFPVAPLGLSSSTTTSLSDSDGKWCKPIHISGSKILSIVLLRYLATLMSHSQR